MKLWAPALILVFSSLGFAPVRSGESAIRRAISGHSSGSIELPAGVIEIHSEIRLPNGARGLDIHGAPSGTVLRAADDFQGRAIFVCQGSASIVFRGFTIEGNRGHRGKPVGLPPSDRPFSQFYRDSGILADSVSGLSIENVTFREISGFPILISRSSGIRIGHATIERCGSVNAKGRNNTTGGILLEEGTHDFRITKCALRDVYGNGIWTHSLYTSPRNYDGDIADNQFSNLARDGIQVGHATRVRVTNNRGARIGYPIEKVDIENLAVPVAIDTAGNVDNSAYANNYFEDIDGQCIDLDGFHNGEVRGNTCINRGPVEAYRYGNFGIAMNNSNPDMRPESVAITDNRIEGAKYGGLFLIGSGNKVTGNRFLNLNMAHCGENTPGCVYKADEPRMLESGIYLAAGAARPAPATGNTIENNQITGYGMRAHCIGFAPGVSRAANSIARNHCSNGITSGK